MFHLLPYSLSERARWGSTIFDLRLSLASLLPLLQQSRPKATVPRLFHHRCHLSRQNHHRGHSGRLVWSTWILVAPILHLDLFLVLHRLGHLALSA